MEKKIQMSEETARKRASSLFWLRITPVLILSGTEFLKVYDMMEERGELKGRIGQWMTIAKSNIDDFFDWSNLVEEKYRNVMMDYSLSVTRGLKKSVFDLMLTFKMYFDKKGLKDTAFKAQMQTALTMVQLENDLWNGFFEWIEDNLHINLREEYRPACLSDTEIYFARVTEVYLQPTRFNLHPTNNYASQQAFNVLADMLLSIDKMDEAAINALKLNNCKEELDELERTAMGMDRLKEKYNIKRQK